MPHFLKRLELNGFKSFADRTVFEFPDGITAIVGPNGSGKSNVIDAIRWLLGEREAKSLRSSRAEDLVFAGTPARPRLGQAQASLYFENHKNFFPVDFKEIVVSRKVSRDSTGNYFLNKSEVRLKDIIDFFARSRLGSKGMVVITQGNSDLFIISSPAERRMMIEEALGLREYQIKKSEAEKRLKNTKINLEKVEALIEEIRPHLRSLKRQTARFEKRGVLEKGLRDLEDEFFGWQRREIFSEMNLLEKESGECREERKTLENEKNGAENKLKEIEANEPRERLELSAVKSEIQPLLEKRSVLQKDIGRLEAQIEIASREKPPAEVGAEKAISLLVKVRENLESGLSGDLEKLKEIVSGTVREINSLLSGGEKEENRFLADLKSRFLKINGDLKDIEKEISSLKEKEALLEKSQENFYHFFRAAVSDLEAVKDRIEKWENQNQKRALEKEKLNFRLEELWRQVEQAGRRKEEFENPQTDFGEIGDRFHVEKRIFKLRGDLASIGDADESLMKEAKETEERYLFLESELKDLKKAKEDLKSLIDDLSGKVGREFDSSLGKINGEFNKFFSLMFGGGVARLKIVQQEANNKRQMKDDGEIAEEGVNSEEEEKEIERGIEISLRLPRKRISSLEALSGGERSLVGIAALFALISVSPPPFFVLDEVDAALDNRNSTRFAEMLKEFSKKTQFVVVTHNQAVMEAADVLYGVTMNKDGTSKVLSLKLEN